MTKPQTVSEPTKSVQPDMGHHLVAAASHHHRNRAVSVHHASALQAQESDCVAATGSLTWRALPRIGTSTQPNP